MSILNYFRRRKGTARVAKERLQIIIAHERTEHGQPDYFPQLQSEIIDVLAKYVKIDKEKVKVQLERQGDNAILELNVTMSERELEEQAI